ncbi:MAG: cell filamentation protein Fic [Chitinivibrionales bacterium]|nr:cell filamentation protein Fic [Chitinivibrionales bacterium]
MAEAGHTLLPEILFGSSDRAISRQISKLRSDGTVRKLAPRVYTANLRDDPEVIVRRNLFQILGHLYSGAVLSHRSAFEYGPTGTGRVYVTYTYTRKASLPGLVVHLLKGPGPTDSDIPLPGGLHASEHARAYLENLQTSHKDREDPKTLPVSTIEEKLSDIVRVNGAAELNRLRDRARTISEQLGMHTEFRKLDRIIGALLSTHPADILTSPVATARAFGLPYDQQRLELFQHLFYTLSEREFKNREDRNRTEQSFAAFAYYESYFSNYIEGTVFTDSDAREVIDSQRPLPARDADSHDILGTYQIVSNRQEMSRLPKSPEEMIEMLLRRHGILLSARTDSKPGMFKDRNNRAGNTEFVDKDLVRGTMHRSFDHYLLLRHPFARAAYMMFVISEIHPFLDGNGRIARIMMNAELVAAQQARIIIPVVYREDYLGALRALSRHRNAEAYVGMLTRAHELSASIVGETRDDMRVLLDRSNAFLEPTEGKLRMPVDL